MWKNTLLLFAFLAVVNSQLLSNVFGNSMVLQREPEHAQLFGWTKESGESIDIEIDSEHTITVESGEDKKWIAILPTHPAGGPHTIKISNSGKDTQTLKDIYFGDVILCSGQSNMQFTTIEAFNSTIEIKDAANYPHIRVFTVGQDTTSDVPLDQLKTIEQPWAVASPESIGGKSWSYFSAVCWFYARDLYDSQKVPLGLISSNWGGTIIQAWSSPESLKKCNASSEESKVVTLENPNLPSVLYNAMIYPLKDLRIRTVVWYQGESNVGQSVYYTCAFPTMIEDWKVLFDLKDIEFTFFFVQLAAWPGGGSQNVALLRQSQEAALTLPYVGMATAVDLGDIDSPYNPIHPRNKQSVGVRLSLTSRAITYGEKVLYKGPFAVDFHTERKGADVFVEVEFEAGTEGSGLMLRTDVGCPEGLDVDECGWYSLKTSDGNWHNTTVYGVEGNKLQLQLESARDHVVGVRYGWASWPVCTLYNKEGLPATPFILTKE